MPKTFHPELIHLSNGIPVILQHFDGLVAATYWWVKVGSADEAPKEAGFAHFLEHMLFKDAAAKETGRASTGMMAQAIESLGGDINAYTSFDQTVYHVTCAAHHWEKVIDNFGVMAKPQRFLKEDFEREREVILEELRKNEDSPGRQLFQSLLSATFKKHPYGKPVIGYVKTLNAAKVADLEAFYRRSYVPSNMGMVLVGPIQDETGARKKHLIKLLEKHYGAGVQANKPLKEKRWQRPMDATFAKKATWAKKIFDVKTPTVSFSFRAPDLRHEDIPSLDVMSSVLAMGELSRLYQKLFYQTSLATDISGGLYVPNDPGLLYFQSEQDSVDKIIPVCEQIFGEFAKLQSDGVTDEELSRVIVNAESERLYATQTADGMAGRLGFLKFILGDLDYDRRYLEDLKNIDSNVIKGIAGKYLDYQRLSGSVLLPKSQSKFDLKKLDAVAAKNLKRPVIAKSKAVKVKKGAKAISPWGRIGAESFTLPSGIRVIYRENSQSHVASIHSVALGGLRLEVSHPVETAEKDWGSSYMMSLTWTKGSAKKDARAIAALVEGHAAGLDGFSGRNTVGVQLTGLSRDWTRLSELFSEVLVEPTFPDEEVGHSRRVAEDTVRGVEDHTSQLCSKLFLETLFESHPYGKLTTGSLESLPLIQGDKLRKFHQSWIRPERLVIAVAGAVKRPELDRFLGDLSSKLEGVAKGKPSGKVQDVTEEPDLKAPRWVEKKLGREQLHIIVGGLGTRVNSPDRYAIRLMQTLLGGQSGRLFIELREKKGLAYTVSPLSFEGIERGYVGTYIACSPQKKDDAISGIQKVLEQLAAKGPTAAEMSRAKEFFLGRRAMELQSDSSLATHYSLKSVYGIPVEEDLEIVNRIQAMTPKEIQEVCRKYLVEPPMVTSVVG